MSVQLQPALVAAARAAVDGVMREVRGATACVVSTEDGFDLASSERNRVETDRLSAMASSMAALANIAGEDSQVGQTDNVIIRARRGHIVMVQARRPDVSLVLSIVAGPDAVMGQILYVSKQAARALEAA